MKKIILLIAWIMPMILFGQTYDSLWKQVKQAQENDLPQTEQEVLRKIIAKAEKGKDYGQLLKAELCEARAKCYVSGDSLQPAVERLKQREQQTQDEVLRAVYDAVLGYIYDKNSALGENSRQTSEDYYARALQSPAQLAAVKTDGYTPFIIKGDDSRIYGHDLLSVIAYEARRFDILRDYYLKAGQNRQAMLMASLEQLRTEQNEGYGPLLQSVWLQRIDSLMEAYSDLPEAGEAALSRYDYMCQNTDATARQKWDYLNNAIQRWGQWPRINQLRNARNELTTLQFHAKMPQRVTLPGKAQEVNLTGLRNLTTLTMRIYQVKASAHDVSDIVLSNEKSLQKIKPLLTPLTQYTQTRTFNGREPYEVFEDSMTLAALPVGVYMLEFESTPKSRTTDRVFYYVSDLRLLMQALPDHQTRYVVVNATTGQPVAKAKLRLTDTRHNTTTLTTDSQGECIYQEKDYRVRSIYVTTDEDKASPQMNGYGSFSYYDNDRTLEHTEIFTDRAIYRPGQKVFVSALLYQTEDGYQNSVVKGKMVTARLRNANHEVVEEKELTTDDYGTCATEFTLPRKGLTGNFSVSIDRESHYFRVEEYKRPTFEVEMPQVKENYADGDTLQVTGTARIYAGVPVQQAKVKYRVERRRAFWWMSYSYYWNQGFIIEESHDTEVASGEVTTDNNGTFQVPVPMVLPKTKYTMFYNFVVTAEVTDQGGETHETQLSLPLGNRKTAFTADIPKQVLTEKGASMTFHLRNAAGNDIDDTVNYRLDNGKWQTTPTHTAVPLPKMKSGSHTVEAICNGDTIKQDFTVFSLDDKRPAVETDDWFFLSDSQFPNDGTPVTLQVGSSDKDVHIVYTLIAGDDVIEQGAVDKSNELLNRKLTYRDDYGNGLLLTFAWVKEGKTYTHHATIKRPLPDTKLKLTWQTFRNRLKPGQQEEWTLVVTGPDGKPAKAQLLATLYDKSLDQLTPHNWALQPYVWLPTPSSSWRFTTPGTLVCSGYTYAKRVNVPNLNFSTFDHDVYPSVFVGYGMMKTRRMMARMNGSVAADEMMMIGAAAPTMDTMDMEEADSGSADDAQEKAIGSIDVEEAVPEQEQSAQMRENLNETAFFYPQLTTDSEGHIAIRFTLPESLTTWRMMGVAHTADMMTGTIDDEAVAQKDVMIQPNMPRFVRVGDKAQLTARIFNISEKEASATAHLLLSDPETGNILYSQEKAVLLAAGSTSAVTFDYDCNDDNHPLLVAKMYVEGDGFSDGEQHYLPVLPNRERVTITLPFTQNEPGTKTIDLNSLMERSSKAPATITHSTLTLEYTNNPAWLMIQALPAVGHAYDDCALCQAASFYANAIGRHILAQNPNAKTVFESWANEQEEHTAAGTAGNLLQSALEKNEELKDLLLNETPWVTEANREDEQKARLADFFDTNLMQQRLTSASDKLAALQGSDGAWSWWPGMSGSWYMTVEISEMLVRLNNMTGTHAEFKEMLDKAFLFMGNEVVDMVQEMKKAEKKGIKQTFPSHKALQWLYMCTIDGRQLPANVQSANAYLIGLLKKETRNQSIYDKAMSAIVLNNKTYIRSLKEYTVYREDLGRYYDTQKALYSWRNYRIPTQVAAIEALQRLTPEDTQTISEMQRWLLQEKRTQMWDTPINSADAIYAFLNGNSQALQSQPKTVIKVDGQQVETSAATAGIGYVKTTMPGDGKQTVTAEKTSTGTSWGAVYLQFMQSSADIAEQQSGISVKRELLTANGGKPTALKVGDRVTVRITVTADRDYDFVQVTDKRAACMEPVNQLSGYRWGYYLVPKDCSTNYFFDRLAKGKHVVETEYYIDRAGSYETGTCTAACTYAPEFRGTAPSERLQVKE